MNAYLKTPLSRNSLAFVLITLSAVIIYSNIYQCPFVFDDIPYIHKILKIHSLSKYLAMGGVLKPRAVANLTLAINYKFGKLNVFGYHLVNVLIHVINGFLAYFLAQTILKQLLNPPARRLGHSNSPKSQVDPTLGSHNIKARASEVVLDGFQSTIDNRQSLIFLMSLVTALIFIAHPIQTQAVTYTVQRCTSMAAMFYLASVFFYLKARIIQQGAEDSDQKSGVRGVRGFWLSAYFGLSIVCGMLAFLSKQNTASLPAVILFSEYLLIDRTWEGWKRKIPWFCLVFVLWAIFILYISGLLSGGIEGRGLLEDVFRLSKETENISRWLYFCTQFNVLVIYIRLLFLPIGQNLDYQYPFNSSFFDGYTPWAFAFLMGIVATGVWNIRKRPVITFGIFWFFITLSVESSIIPIQDALFEHRLYLPMFGFALAISYLVFHTLSRKRNWAVAVSGAVIISLGTATYLRNRVWQDPISFWSDVVSKSPKSFIGQMNFGVALMGQGNVSEAIDHYRGAIKIKPDYADAYSNLGIALAAQGRLKDAARSYSKALQINPSLLAAYNGLGIVLARQGRLPEALSYFFEALRIDPRSVAVRSNLDRARALLEKSNKTPDITEIR